MKKIAALIIVAMALAFCVGCGPYADYSGTYSKTGIANSDVASVTLTMTASGDFKCERKWKSSYVGPEKDSKNNVIEGKYTVDDKGTITFSFSYYDQVTGRNMSATAQGTLKDKNLSITGDKISGSYTKK